MAIYSQHSNIRCTDNRVFEYHSVERFRINARLWKAYFSNISQSLKRHSIIFFKLLIYQILEWKKKKNRFFSSKKVGWIKYFS